MSAALSLHQHYHFQVHTLDAELDVLSFELLEGLSLVSSCEIEFTSTQLDIASTQMLCKEAQFCIRPAQPAASAVFQQRAPGKAYRQLCGVITAFDHLGASADQARYRANLQPRLALLGRGRDHRLYQQQSVPEVVEHILRTRHDFRGQDFHFDLDFEYPRREQIMQFGESDLAFIQRLLAEVGIWYRFSTDERLGIDVLELRDSSRALQRGVSLAQRAPCGMASAASSVWDLQARHAVVEQRVSVRAYDPCNAAAYLDGEVDQDRGSGCAYGEAYHYAEAYTQMGLSVARLFDQDLPRESGYFYARLAHERYLNGRTRLSGLSNSPQLAPGQLLQVGETTLQAFEPEVVIVATRASGARSRSFELRFEGIPNVHNYCFRPPLLARPRIAGTLPARISSTRTNDRYSHIDDQGRYRVQFLFDREHRDKGKQSAWLRLARPYAGDLHGLHLPLLDGTEVAVAFEQGDPDRPYIAHALHDSRHPDHVSFDNHKRNVLRTEANNKLRMDDTQGQQHIKLATEHGGKSQLNLGHVVDHARSKRGEGFELRSDAWGTLRAGRGVFISADAQPLAQGPVLQMDAALGRLQSAAQQLEDLSADAAAAQAEPADVQAQLQLLREQLDQLKASVLLLGAPKGIALSSGGHLQLAARRNLMLNAGEQADVSVVKRLFMGIGQGLSLFVRKCGIKLIANQGPVQLQAQNGPLELFARDGLQISSSEDEISIVAHKKITLNAGGTYLTLEPVGIEAGTVGDCNIKAARFEYSGPANMLATHPKYPLRQAAPRLDLSSYAAPNLAGPSWVGMPYTLYADGRALAKGVLDGSGQLPVTHEVVTTSYQMVLTSGVRFDIPAPGAYRNLAQGELANKGLHKAADNPDQRALYAEALATDSEETNADA